MNLSVMGKSFLLLLIVALTGYGFSIIGVPGSIIDSFWKLIALVIAVSLVSGWVFPYLRGVRKEDQLVALVARRAMHDKVVHNHIGSVIVTAAEDGRLGGKIKVRLWNGKRAEGIITSYAKTFAPATIRLTESEV